MIRRRKKSTENQKVKNVKPNIYDNIHFKSKLETYCYQQLQKYNLEANYEKLKFTLIEPFQYNNEKVRAMTFLPDFSGPEFIIECKGMMNDAFPLRWKIFKYHLANNNITYNLYLPRNKKDVDAVIADILLKRKENGKLP